MLFLTSYGWSLKPQPPQSIYHYGKGRIVKGIHTINTSSITGRDGTYDIVLHDNEYRFDQKTIDLLIHFNGRNNRPWQEQIANIPEEDDDKPKQRYLLQKKNFSFSSTVKVFGRSSAKFARSKSTLLLRPNHGSLFRQTKHTGSFTIEFWLNPSTLSN
ncbi:MAG: hypothetical protein IEMM0008_0679 [bacterium]|nr:MAG: hypothetical protein IEMM0008_0679 [bacterium]